MPHWKTALMLLVLGWLSLGTQAQNTNARIIAMWEMLNVREAPRDDAPVVAELSGRTAVLVSGRSRDNAWYYLQAPVTGWVASGYVELLSITRDALPILEAPAPAAPAAADNASPDDNAAPAPPAAPVSDSNGRTTAALLNMRAAPDTAAAVIAQLPQNTAIRIVGRSADNAWFLLQNADGSQGWVAAAYVATDLALSSLPVSAETVLAAPAEASAPPADEAPLAAPGSTPYFTLGAASVNAYALGQALGNRRDVFSKVGDSITAEPAMYSPLGYGQYDLGGYGYLQDTVTFFSQTSLARGANSFAHVSLAALPGWTTNNVLNPANADGQFCQAGESPLACEYRLSRPAVALIMLGSNDVTFVQAEQYANNLRRIVQISLDSGVIPVLSTIPPRRGYEERTDFYNSLIVQVAREYGVSLWDYGAAMRTLPNDGLSEDGLHPSLPPGGYENGANFTGDFLQYGYVLRNWMALHVLDALRTQVLR